jgi:hypothetical protein
MAIRLDWEEVGERAPAGVMAAGCGDAAEDVVAGTAGDWLQPDIKNEARVNKAIKPNNILLLAIDIPLPVSCAGPIQSESKADFRIINYFAFKLLIPNLSGLKDVVNSPKEGTCSVNYSRFCANAVELPEGEHTVNRGESAELRASIISSMLHRL